MAAPVVDCVVDVGATLGEGAIWSVAEQALWWVDIAGKRLHRHDPARGENASWDMGMPAGCLALRANGRVVVALTEGFHEFDPATGHLQFLSGPRPAERGHRFNDGSVDHRGRFLAGTMPLTGPTPEDSSGTLYSFDGTAPARRVMDGFHTINGLAFSPDGRTAYVSDSFPDVRLIWAHDYDPDDGAWSNRRLFFDTRAVAGRPDGAAIDTDGCYWMAGVGGGHLLRLTPEGRIDMDIPMPVARPTRPAFGGPDMRTLYCTSIGAADDPAQPQAGGVFALTVPGVQGVPLPVMEG
ncbi:SMP-30/gluconolactonase/LRE family protein [Oceaniglobus trochenteri]|uniref:SMP-30/gluconolactonase/LRE family protein n=1 Tax=Oceaniglobus trochenteri TaxID=2763260 RepID=UPI001CFFC17D|nr:SMP-30/gluconolactonase/LRE family protein [Oceaniglobus trochenteri]